jgi:O-methyltransferase
LCFAALAMNCAATDRYLSLLKRCLTRTLFPDQILDWDRRTILPFDPTRRADGSDWPTDALTMVGMARLDNLQMCIETALRDGVPGDLMEAGVWRGGCGILMRAVLDAHDVPDRQVWLADSFQGRLPPPSSLEYPADVGDPHSTFDHLRVSQTEVAANFRMFDLLDDRVRFLPGWFRDTLPTAPVEQLAVLRLDGDMYESTWVALNALYPKVAPGGFVIVDDYGAIPACRQAVEDYRAAHGVVAPVTRIDWAGVYWRR